MQKTDKRSNIALGTMQFLWTTTEADSYKILDVYTERGGNTIDTADMYTNWVEGLRGGEAETIIGNWLKRKKNREKLFLSTKVRSRMWEGNDGEGLSKAHIIKAIEQSLRRLQTEYIDLYLSHWSDFYTPIEETLSAYETLIRQGKVRFIGCSNYAKKDLTQALEKGEGRTSYTYLQAYYNLIDRKHFETELAPIAKRYKLKTMIYGPLASGFLTGAYRKNTPLPKHDRAQYVKEKMTEENFSILEKVEKIADNHGATISQIALAWFLKKDLTPIIGADNTEQVEVNMRAAEIRLTTEDLNTLNEA